MALRRMTMPLYFMEKYNINTSVYTVNVLLNLNLRNNEKIEENFLNKFVEGKAEQA